MKKILFALFCFLSTASFSQDLIVTAISGDMSFGANDFYTGSVTVQNTGIVGTSAGFKVSTYLSMDSIWDTSDFIAGGGYTYEINAGETKVLSIYWGNQINLPPGTYYLIGTVNGDHHSQETDYSNNMLVKSGFTVTPSSFDFKFTSFSLADSSSLHVADIFLPHYRVENPGTHPTYNRVFTSFFLSKDQALDDADIFCGKYSNYADKIMSDSTGYPWTDLLSIPFFAEIGQYYVIAKVDPDDEFVETNESNNTSVLGPVSVKPFDIDLEARDLSVNGSGTPSGSFYGEGYLTVVNNGTTGLSSVYFEAYLSTDKFLDESGDLRMDVNNFGPPPTYIGPHSINWVPLNFSHYAVAPGTYYVIVIASRYIDATPDNNVVVSYNTITIGVPDPQSIAIQSAKFTSLYDSLDKQFILETGFKNNLSSQFDDVIHYQVTIKDASDVIQYSTVLNQYLALDSAESTTRNFYISLDKGLPLGIYTVDLTCADTAKCHSDNYSLQLKVDQKIRTLSGTIQGEDGTPISKGKLFLYQKHDNGSVSFIQKIVPTTSSDFAFQIDHRQHTLYFIPDVTDFPQYVPTIFGKTVTLSQNNFITISKDSAVTFEILKVHTLPPGPQMISGNINTGEISGASYSKSSAVKTMSVTAPITVLLLDEAGEVVGITQTDASGNYAFTNLPAAKYEVIVPFELDAPALMKTPFAVDVTTESKDVSFNFSTPVPVTVVKILQSITFSAFEPVTYVHEPIALNATSSAGLPVSYSSLDLSVATIADNQITIVGVGTAIITASQSGNSDYKAIDVILNFEVGKGVLKVIAENKTKNYSEANPPLTLYYEGFKSGEDLINSGVTAPSIGTSASQNSDAGTYEISFTGGEGGLNYTFDFVGATLTINKIDQSITFNTELPDVSSAADPISLDAQATSGLPVTFNITEGSDIVNLNNSTLTLTGKAGTVTVEALQNGDVNHNSAESIVKSFKVNLVLGVKPEATPLVTMSPNPTKGELVVTAGTPINILTLWDIFGHKVNSIENLNQNEYRLNLSGYVQGTYLVNVITKDGVSVSSRVVLVK